MPLLIKPSNKVSLLFCTSEWAKQGCIGKCLGALAHLSRILNKVDHHDHFEQVGVYKRCLDVVKSFSKLLNSQMVSMLTLTLAGP